MRATGAWQGDAPVPRMPRPPGAVESARVIGSTGHNEQPPGNDLKQGVRDEDLRGAPGPGA